MGKHLKRLAAPKSWKIERKVKKWAVKPKPGPHKLEDSLPLLLIVRDFLKYARTTKEAKKIITNGKVVVNKIVRRDPKFSVGLMDILEIPDVKERRIIVLDDKGRLLLKEISAKNAKFKLCKILNKTIVKGGHVQLNLHDGRNLLIKVKDPTKADEDSYNTNDTLVLDAEKNIIIKHLPYKPGALALVTGGSHIAKLGKIKELKKVRSPEPNIVILSYDDSTVQTIRDYIFVVGEEEPFIPEVAK